MVLSTLNSFRLCLVSSGDPNQITKALLWLYSLESWVYQECNRACREEHGLVSFVDGVGPWGLTADGKPQEQGRRRGVTRTGDIWIKFYPGIVEQL